MKKTSASFTRGGELVIAGGVLFLQTFIKIPSLKNSHSPWKNWRLEVPIVSFWGVFALFSGAFAVRFRDSERVRFKTPKPLTLPKLKMVKPLKSYRNPGGSSSFPTIFSGAFAVKLRGGAQPSKKPCHEALNRTASSGEKLTPHLRSPHKWGLIEENQWVVGLGLTTRRPKHPMESYPALSQLQLQCCLVTFRIPGVQRENLESNATKIPWQFCDCDPFWDGENVSRSKVVGDLQRSGIKRWRLEWPGPWKLLHISSSYSKIDNQWKGGVIRILVQLTHILLVKDNSIVCGWKQFRILIHDHFKSHLTCLFMNQKMKELSTQSQKCTAFFRKNIQSFQRVWPSICGGKNPSHKNHPLKQQHQPSHFFTNLCVVDSWSFKAGIYSEES